MISYLLKGILIGLLFGLPVGAIKGHAALNTAYEMGKLFLPERSSL